MADFSGFISNYDNNNQSGIAPGGTVVGAQTYTTITASAVGGLAYIPFGEIGSIFYFKMRAFKDPLGSGFVSWTVINNPDPNGDEAPEPIVAGTAVIMATWIG